MIFLLGLVLLTLGAHTLAGTGWALLTLGAALVAKHLFDRWVLVRAATLAFAATQGGGEPDPEPEVERGHGGRMGAGPWN